MDTWRRLLRVVGLVSRGTGRSARQLTNSEFVWISHGHPDHLSLQSLDLLRGKRFLLADHVGGRIRDGLKERGFNVTVLRDREWYPISDRIRILSIADYNQDSIILIDMGGQLIVNLNDAL